jgi:hypothetical protein
MNLMGVVEVEPDEFLEKKFSYPCVCADKRELTV